MTDANTTPTTPRFKRASYKARAKYTGKGDEKVLVHEAGGPIRLRLGNSEIGFDFNVPTDLAAHFTDADQSNGGLVAQTILGIDANGNQQYNDDGTPKGFFGTWNSKGKFTPIDLGACIEHAAAYCKENAAIVKATNRLAELEAKMAEEAAEIEALRKELGQS